MHRTKTVGRDQWPGVRIGWKDVLVTDLSTVGIRVRTAADRLRRAESLFEASLRVQNAGPDLQLAVDDVVQQQRSALDFLANRLVEHATGGPAKQVAYPMERSESEYNGKADRLMPGVRASRPDIMAIVRLHQRWQPGYEWLGQLNELVNRGKHVDLVPQTRQETPHTEVTRPGSGSVSWTSGVTFGAGVSVMGAAMDPRTQLPVPTPGVKVTRTVYVDWLLPDGRSALGALRQFQAGLELLVSEIAQIAGMPWPA